MLAGQNFDFPSGNGLFLKRGVSVDQGLDLGLKGFHAFKDCGLTVVAIY